MNGTAAGADRAARRLARRVEVASWLFAALGLVLPVAVRSPVFAPYRDALARGAGLAETGLDTRLLGFMAGITGGAIAGKWILHAIIARVGLRHGRRWARDATAVGLLAWVVVDSAASLFAGAWANVALDKPMPLALAGIPLWLGWDACAASDPAPPRADAVVVARVVTGVAVVGVLSGLGIAFGGATWLFAPWFAQLDASGLAAAVAPADARVQARLLFGPIGGCTVAQFAMIGMVAHGPLRRGAAWAAPACLASLVAWFAIDSAYSLAHGGVFNVWLINLPTLVFAGAPLAWAWARMRQ